MGLEAVELVMAWEEAFGIDIPDEVAARIRTPIDAGDYICARLAVERAGDCRTRRTFHRVRRDLCAALGLSRGAVRPATPLATLLADERAVERWNRVGRGYNDWAWPTAGRKHLVRDLVASLLGDEPAPEFGTDRGVETVADVVRNVAAFEPDVRPSTGEAWTRERVMLTMRRCTLVETRVRGFRDDQEYVHDMGMM